MTKVRAGIPPGSQLPGVTGWTLSLVVGVSLFGCATPKWANDWALVECFSWAGVRVHVDREQYWHVAGVRKNWSHPADGTWAPAWRFPSDSSSVNEGGAELSADGRLAVAWWSYRRVEVFDFETGASLAKTPCRACAVAWSNDGTRLAYLSQVQAVRTGQDFNLVVCDGSLREIARWPLHFGSVGKGPWMSIDAWAMSWDANDEFVAVSTRSVPPVHRPWKAVIVDITKGPIFERAYADAFFVGPRALVACEKRKTIFGHHERRLLLLHIEGDELIEQRTLPGRMPLAASRPDEGVFLVWQEPPWWELWAPKGYWLELRKLGASGSVRNRFFASSESLTLIRRDAVPQAPSRREAPDATENDAKQ